MKKVYSLALAIFVCMILAGCGHEHSWTAADCSSPQICSDCGETQGEALGHSWVAATCEESKYCSICGKTSGKAVGHAWIDATCVESRYCDVCGLTSGEPLGHTWIESTCTAAAYCEICEEVKGEPSEHIMCSATCVAPETCDVCGYQIGDPLGHVIESWETIHEATCTETGIETGLCTVCSEVVEQDIEVKEHTPGEWEVKSQPTAYEDGIRVKNCVDCGIELEEEYFSMSKEELESQYKSKCKSISYDSLARTPGDYEGEYVKFSGYVVQVCYEAESILYYSTYRVATDGKYDDVVYIKVDNYGSGSRILEDDYITFYGEYDGLYSYETVMGAKVTIPSVVVEYVD